MRHLSIDPNQRIFLKRRRLSDYDFKDPDDVKQFAKSLKRSRLHHSAQFVDKDINKKRTDETADQGREWEEQYLYVFDASVTSIPDSDAALLSAKGLKCHDGPSKGDIEVQIFAGDNGPSKGDIGVQIFAGDNGPRSGCVKLVGPRNYWGRGQHAQFVLPFDNVEEVFVVQNKHCRKGKEDEQRYEIIIVPTAATGSSSLMRMYPQVIAFTWPADEIAEEKGIPLLSEFMQVMNDQLASTEKSVYDLRDERRLEGYGKYVEAELRPVKKTRVRAGCKVAGGLYFLDKGFFYHCKTQRMIKIYMPFDSVAAGTVIAHWCEADEMTMSIDLNLKVMEPYYNVNLMTDIRFVLEDVFELDKIEVHAEQHQIPLELWKHSHEDYWYDKIHPVDKVPFDAWEDMWKGLKLRSPREFREALEETMGETTERLGLNIKREPVDHVKPEPLEETERRIKPEPLEESERRIEPEPLQEAERRIKPEPRGELQRKASGRSRERVPYGICVWDYPDIKAEED